MNANAKSKYKTKHREELLAYLKTVPGIHITVGDVCSYFKERGMAIGQTTVYRQMERMVDDGVVNKYIIDANSPACFEYIGEEAHLEGQACFHCKCEKCGKLIHLQCEELVELQEHLLAHHRFALNPMRTVFYGICDACSV